MLSAIIVAAGSSRRMGFDKLAARLDGRSVLRRSIDAFLETPDVAEIIVVCPPERWADLKLPQDLPSPSAAPMAAPSASTPSPTASPPSHRTPPTSPSTTVPAPSSPRPISPAVMPPPLPMVPPPLPDASRRP
jgi:hypothetical protein